MAAFVAYNARKDSLNDVVVLHVEVGRLVSKDAILVSRLKHPDRPARRGQFGSSGFLPPAERTGGRPGATFCNRSLPLRRSPAVRTE